MLKSVNKKQFGTEFPHQAFCTISGEINNSTWQSVSKFIMESNFETEDKPQVLNMIINTLGGSVYDTLGIIDIMQSSSIPIRTIGNGNVASSGIFLLMSGSEGNRMVTPNCNMMCHTFSFSGLEGREHDLKSSVKDFDIISSKLIKLCMKHSKLKCEKKVRKFLMPQMDNYITPEDALKYGIIDRIGDLK